MNGAVKTLLVVALALAAGMAKNTWLGIEIALWLLVAGAIGLSLYETLKQTVNYESLRVWQGRIEYVCAGEKTVVDLAQVLRLEFVREEALFHDLDGPYLESRWQLQTATQPFNVTILDEWPHRALLLRTFRAHLPGFDETQARKCVGAACEGRWICYEKAPDRATDASCDVRPDLTTGDSCGAQGPH
jgi:hypothetical protein